MALSGSLTTNSYNGKNLIFAWTATQSITNNTSTVSWTLKGGGSSTEWHMAGPVTLTAGGATRVNRTDRFQLSVGTLVGSGSFTVNHNATTGAGTFSASISAAIYAYAVNVSGSQTFTLNDIPRQSPFTATIDSSNAISVAITRPSSAFTHDVKYSIGSYSNTQTNIATSTSYAIPDTWYNAIPNAVSGTVTVAVTTKVNGTAIGTSSKTVTMTIPSAVVPTVGTMKVTRNDNSVPAGWGVYVQNQSGATINITGAVGAYSSTITSYTVTTVGATYTSVPATIPKIMSSGNYVIKGEVTDSRGRKASVTETITVYPWEPVRITSFDVQRCKSDGTLDDEGTYLRAIVTDTVSAIPPSGTLLNTSTHRLRYSRKGEGSWSGWTSYTPGTPLVFGGGAIDVDRSYEVEIYVSDWFGAVTQIVAVTTAIVTVDYRAGGKGIAFGKVAEYDRMEIGPNMPLHIIAPTSTEVDKGFIRFRRNDGSVLAFLSTGEDGTGLKLHMYDHETWTGYIEIDEGGNIYSNGVPVFFARQVTASIANLAVPANGTVTVGNNVLGVTGPNVLNCLIYNGGTAHPLVYAGYSPSGIFLRNVTASAFTAASNATLRLLVMGI